MPCCAVVCCGVLGQSLIHVNVPSGTYRKPGLRAHSKTIARSVRKHRTLHNTELTPVATPPPRPCLPLGPFGLPARPGLAPPRLGLENAMLPSEWTGPCVRANAAAAGGA